MRSASSSAVPRRAALLLLLAACESPSASPPPAPRPTPAAAPAPPPPASPSSPRPPSALDAYLAAIPPDQPTLSDTVTGTPIRDPAVTLDRCRLTGWSYTGCQQSFPTQGLQWARWACLHDDTPHARSVLCTRLAEYLYLGIGGPADPAIASAMFDWQCQTHQAAYRHNCYAAAELLMFAEPTRAREFLRRGCDSPDDSPIGCRSLLPRLEAGIEPRELTVKKYRGLSGIADGSTCKLWLWNVAPDTCSARLACGDVILYGATGGQLPCTKDGTGGEDMTQRDDGDPAIMITNTTVTAHDDDSGRLGAFALDATFR